MTKRRSSSAFAVRAMAAGAFLCLTGAAGADIVYETNGPFGGPFGFVGFDVFAFQSVGVRFTPDQDYTLDRLSAWFMSNDFEGDNPATVRLSLYTDHSEGDVSTPGDEIETMEFVVSAIGWEPVLESVESDNHPLLEEGVRYWVVAMSDAESENGVWVWAVDDTGFNANTSGDQHTWQPGGEGAVSATVVEGTPVGGCYPDLTGDGALDLFDFLAFVNLFNAADPGADCDDDGSWTLFDFLCFTNAFNAGC